MKQGFFATTLCAVFLFSCVSFNTLHAGEFALVGEEAGEALFRGSIADVFGKGAVEDLSRGELEEMAQQSLGKGLNDIGELPMEGKVALRSELIDSYLTLKSKGVQLEELFAEKNLATLDVRNNFIEDLKGIQERGGGFGDMQYEAINKFAPEENELTKFPASAKQAQEGLANKAIDFDSSAIPKSQQALEEAQDAVYAADKDLNWATELKDKVKITEAETRYNAANKNLTDKIKANNTELNAEVKKTEANVETTKAKSENESSSGDAQKQLDNKAAEGDANNKLTDADKGKEKEDRRASLEKYDDATATKEGTATGKENIKKAEKKLNDAKKTKNQEKIKNAQDELAEAKRSSEAGTAEQYGQAQEDLNTFLKDEYGNSGAKGKATAEKEWQEAQGGDTNSKEYNDAKEKYDEYTTKKENVDRLKNADLKADEDVVSTRADAMEKGQLGWKTKGRWQEYWKKSKGLASEQFTNGIIMGFTFAFPNWVIEKVQTAWNNKNEREATKAPQKFGNMWMQIPYQLISDGDRENSGKPLEAKYLYVGLEKSPKASSVKRDDTIDLSNAQFFMPRDDYDEYAIAGIGDPGFPNKMVHMNSGFHFYGDGIAIDSEEVIQLVGDLTKANQWARQNLKNHLDDQAGQITDPNVSYAGSTVIADQFDSGENDQLAVDYPELAKLGDKYGSVLNAAIKSLMNGTIFGTTSGLNIQGFKALDSAKNKSMLEELGLKDAPLDKPWPAYGIYVYQTADTQNVKSVRKKLDSEGKHDIADKVVEYVVMVDDENNILPLQMPQLKGMYNFPSYTVNPAVTKMLSLYDGTLYEKFGKTEPSGLVTSKLIPQVFYDGANQINAMNKYIGDQLQYGPFVVGDKRADLVSKQLQEQGVYVYKVADNDGVAVDYMVATEGVNVIQLPGVPTNFVSLVTSRIYDNELVPYDKKSGGRKDLPYTVCKISEEAPPLVVVGNSCSGIGTSVTTGLTAPLYSLYMDPEVNPNIITTEDIVSEDLSWLEEKMGGSLPQPPPVPVQWALSERGPATAVDDQGAATQRISDLLAAKASDLRTTIDQAYTSWKKTHSEMTNNEREALETFQWVDIMPRPITLRVTSKEDVDNGNHVYTSPFYPDDYLVLADDAAGTQNFGQEYDVAEPQAFAISLSSGKVYSRANNGEMASISDKSLDVLLQNVQSKQGAFLPALLKDIKKSQSVYASTQKREQYGPDTAFGRFQFYLYEPELKSGQYVYADVSDIKDPDTLTEQQLMDQVTDYFVAIGLKEDVDKKDEDATANPNNWVYGKQLGADTVLVVSLVTGILYDRGGGYQGYFKPFGKEADNLDIQKGFVNDVMGYLKNTWSQESKSTQMRAALKTKITALLNVFYEKLSAEKKEIADALLKESQRYKPLDANTIKNIDAQPYVESLLTTSPVRYIKNYQGKYYMITPKQTFAGKTVAPKRYIDYNVGDAGKDNNVGMYYDTKGNPLIILEGFELENARAYAGIVVKDNGSQLLDITADHPSIPVEAMVELDPKTLKTKLAGAWTTYKNALDAIKKNPDNNEVLDTAQKASDQVGLIKQEYESAKVAQKLNLGPTRKLYFNETTNSYFLEKDGTRYIDLTGGYEFYTDGAPRLSESQVLINKNHAKTDKMFLGVDQHDLLLVQYMTDRIVTVSPYSSWFTYDLIPSREYGDEFVRYSLASAANNLDNLYVYHNKEKKEYYVFMKKYEEVDAVFTGTYKEDPSLNYSLLRYFRTRKKGQKEGTFVDDRELDPTYVVWDGSPDLKFQQLYYRDHLLDLKRVDDSTFTAEFQVDGKPRSITLKKQEKSYGTVKAHYITITDGAKEYDFQYDSSILDPELPSKCDVETEVMRLNFWKQCQYKLNVVTDAFGVTRLVNDTPTLANLAGIQEGDKTRVLKAAGDRKDIVSGSFDLLYYDAENNRYLYKLNESRDSTWNYYNSRWNGWMVDLHTGILYSIVTPAGTWHPLGTMLASQLYLLLDRLEVSVANVPATSTDGEPLYKSTGEPVLDKNKKQIYVKPGLMYRTQSIVETDARGNITNILNKTLVDMAKGSKDTQF